MVTIQNPVLKKQFEQFSKLGSETEKRVFWEQFAQSFNQFSDGEQEAMRQDWKVNVTNVDKRLKEIGKQLDEATAIQVFPANGEERRLIEALLSRMNVKFEAA